MGKHFWMKHLNDQSRDNKQPGCMSGLVNVLDYHHWHSNVRKMIQHRKYEGDWCPEKKSLNYQHDAEKRLDKKKRSLKSRLKKFITKDGQLQGKEGLNLKSKLERTYSIHHLESLDDGFDKLRSDWQNPIIFFPRNVDEIQTKAASEQNTNVLEIFKVDKDLLIKHLQDADEDIVSFSRSAFGLNTKRSKFSKSRSFPVAELSRGTKLKPIKLEDKQREVLLSLPKQEKPQTVVNQAPRFNGPHISYSLNESLDKYARLFETSFQTDAKLNASKSLKLTNEYGNGPMYFRRIRSSSLVDSYYSNLNFEVFGENDSVVTEKDRENLSPIENIETKEDNASDSQLEQETEWPTLEFQICEGSPLESSFHDIIDLEKDEISDKTTKCPKKNKNSDLYYIRHLLDTSGIEVGPAEMTWHASDQPLGPQLFEEMETHWGHKQEELNGCWHHKMLFDLVNEVLIEVYDVSLPYYPKPLSSSCYVRPFPVGKRIIDDVIMTVGSLMNLKPDERESLDWIVGRDLGCDRMWMNLQVETECVALDIEDMVFGEILDEVIFS